MVDLHYASSCDDTQESIFFQSRTFSCSQAVFFTNTTRFELTEPPRHRHMICIRKAKSTWRSSNLNCLAKTLFPVQSVCCIVGYLTRSLCGPQRPLLISSCCISWTRPFTLLEFRLHCDLYDPGIGLPLTWKFTFICGNTRPRATRTTLVKSGETRKEIWTLVNTKVSARARS